MDQFTLLNDQFNVSSSMICMQSYIWSVGALSINNAEVDQSNLMSRNGIRYVISQKGVLLHGNEQLLKKFYPTSAFGDLSINNAKVDQSDLMRPNETRHT